MFAHDRLAMQLVISTDGVDGDNLLGFINNKTCSSKVHEANQQGTEKQNWKHFYHFALSLSLLVTFCFNNNLDVKQMRLREIDWPNQVARIFVFLNRQLVLFYSTYHTFCCKTCQEDLRKWFLHKFAFGIDEQKYNMCVQQVYNVHIYWKV